MTDGRWYGYAPITRWRQARYRLWRLVTLPTRLGRRGDGNDAEEPRSSWEIRHEHGAWVIRPATGYPYLIVDRTQPPAYSTHDIPADDHEAAMAWARSVLPPEANHLRHNHHGDRA